ncbi:hypothetical protein GGTG_05775 [Gaeumannomyces tritici R3-111a-1]|uniref:Uncharacterized protein n=1 Tax=Gaeumannomyces tritici (strain R3-111a-1) TaxID=644352 RepID=J3NWW4_GAET3|nr:hypothetical protein GGTG_05775 [Gaeumannomyces tritici R3-111a-1]EJT75846.1 hypothetical protein GGTG_05775 [Gaeumannomyces tritici R3-111a-1]
MRIRLPFAGGFFFLLLIAGYAGLTSLQLGHLINDKLLHFLTFFVLTIVFYWIVDTNRRRTLNLTLTVCTGALGVGSEFLQAILPNDRDFDVYDIVANLVGSLAGLGLCSWYHKRMLERKRVRRGYGAVAGEEGGDGFGEEDDLELGEGLGLGGSGHEEGITEVSRPHDDTPANGGGRGLTLEEEVDNWDENEVDAWDDADGAGDIGDSAPVTKNKTGKGPMNGDGDGAKRAG